jgi:lysophospholipase L1-like esterase
LNPNAEGLSNGVVKQVDSNGFWKYGAHKKNAKKKILFLGDSVTMGIGVQSDSTFAGLINASFSDVEILNPSLIGYSNKDYLNIVKKLFADEHNKFNVSDVFIFWCLNDVYSNYDALEMPGFSSDGTFGEVISFLRKNSKLFHLLKKLFSDRPKAYYLFDSRFYNSDNADFKKSLSNLSEIKSILNSYNVNLTVILLPYEYQLEEKKDSLFFPQKIFSSALRKSSIHNYDFSKDLKNENIDPSDLFLFGDGIHFSTLGHKQIAKIFERYFHG